MSKETFFVTAPMPLGGPDEFMEESWQAAYHQLLDSVDSQTLVYLYDERHGEEPEIDDEVPRGEELAQMSRKARDEFHDMITSIFEDQWIDAQYLYLNGGFILLTGGDSWGDSPTECFDDVAALNNIFHFSDKKTREELGFFVYENA